MSGAPGFFAGQPVLQGKLVLLRPLQAVDYQDLYAVAEANSEIEIGWSFLARSHWGGRYNREMKRLMLRHAFRFVSNVIFLVDHQNFRPQRAVESIGGVLGGTRPGSSGREAFVYRITRASFLSSSEE
jgi:RimJ/RimL family protein N-acetyltransferase